MSGESQALRVVVLCERPEPSYLAAAEAIAEAFTTEQDKDTRVEHVITTESRVPSATSDPLQEADAVVAFDARSLDRAREAGVPFRVALFPFFDLGWAGDLSEADLILVAHDAWVDEVIRKGAPADRVKVTGPIVPRGLTTDLDRARAKAGFRLAADRPVVLVPIGALVEHDLQLALIQLSLVQRATFLFDVGKDLEAAETLRRHGSELHAFMFSDDDSYHRYWEAADVVMCRAREWETVLGVGVGASLILLSPGRSDAFAAEALRNAGVARVSETTSTIATTLQSALEPAALQTAQAAAKKLDAGRSALRAVKLVRETWRARRGGSIVPRGLPVGLEPLGPSRPKS